jgi:2-isopropylmalate synthase
MNHPTDYSNAIMLYDTTLRDGAQREGLALSVSDKLNIAHYLDDLGIPFIEGGWPGANPKDIDFFNRIKQEPLSQAQLVAFCSTRRPQSKLVDNSFLYSVLKAETQWVTVFGKSWDLHVTEGLQTTLTENLEMITDSISFFRSQGRRVIYDAEHWFDGYRYNSEYALETLQAAIAAGAEWIVLCDTNGGSLPSQITSIVTQVKAFFQSSQFEFLPLLGIHAHDDSGTAVANTLSAVEAGVRMVQGTMNGYGERCGNANLCTLIPNLQVKLHYPCLSEQKLAHLTRTSRAISEIVNLPPNEHAPFVGASAFAHKAGIHVSAIQRSPRTYEHLNPEVIGNRRRIVISDQAGLSNIIDKAQSFGLKIGKQDTAARDLLQLVKKLENEGYQFEVADASFELLMQKALGQRPTFFHLNDFNVQCGVNRAAESTSQAIVNLAIAQQEIHVVATGNGPISALDQALRKALITYYPQISQFYLEDYKVRIMDSCHRSSAKTRVLVDSSNGQKRWTTIGVSTNVITASYQAIAEALEYGLQMLAVEVPSNIFSAECDPCPKSELN